MRNLITIDPGVHDFACAWFQSDAAYEVRMLPAYYRFWEDDDGVIGVLDFGDYQLYRGEVHEVVVEKPQFDGRESKHVIDLACVGADAAGRINAPSTIYLTPREWKGSAR